MTSSRKNKLRVNCYIISLFFVRGRICLGLAPAVSGVALCGYNKCDRLLQIAKAYRMSSGYGNYFFLPLYSSETVNFARPFARRAANTRRPFFVAILSRKPCLFFLFLLEGWNVLFIVLYYYMFLFKKYFALFSLQNYSFFLIRQRIREVFCPKMVIFIMLRRGVGLTPQNPSLERCSCAHDWAFLYVEGLYNVHIRLFIAFLL